MHNLHFSRNTYVLVSQFLIHKDLFKLHYVHVKFCSQFDLVLKYELVFCLLLFCTLQKDDVKVVNSLFILLLLLKTFITRSFKM